MKIIVIILVLLTSFTSCLYNLKHIDKKDYSDQKWKKKQ